MVTNEAFRKTLEAAVAGSHEALEEILQLYEPMIRKYSYIYGKPDEDLRQYIMLHIALNIGKFSI